MSTMINNKDYEARTYRINRYSKKMTRKISLIIAMLITYLVNAQGIDESLYVFDFGLNYMPVKERTTYLYEQGFRGVSFAIKDEQQIKKLKAYLNTEEVKSEKF